MSEEKDDGVSKRVDMAGESYIVAFRVEHLLKPYVESDCKICEGCGEDVWVSKNLRGVEAHILCLGCAGKKIAEMPVEELQVRIRPEVKREVEKFFEDLCDLEGNFTKCPKCGCGEALVRSHNPDNPEELVCYCPDCSSEGQSAFYLKRSDGAFLVVDRFEDGDTFWGGLILKRIG